MSLYLYKSAVVNLSPRVATVLGSGSGSEVQADEHAALEANLLLLKCQTGTGSILFVSVDALYPGARLRKDLLRSFPAFLTEDSFFLAASHTHNAPMLDSMKPHLGKVCEIHYQSVLQALRSAISNLEARPWLGPITITSHSYNVDSVVARRRVLPIVWRQGKASFFRAHFLPNPRGATGVVADVIELRAEGTGRIVGCFWVMPCHPVSYPCEDELSAHYVGVARQQFRDEVARHSEAPFVFLQGASGNLRPPAYAETGKRAIRDWLIRIFLGRIFGQFSRDGYARWASDLSDSLVSTLNRSAGSATSSPLRLGPDLETARATLQLERYFRYSAATAREISLHHVRLGSISLVGVSGEPTWNFRRQSAKQFGSDCHFIMVGCIDDSFGYITTDFEALFGGYEVDGFLPAFSLAPGPKRRELSEHIRGKIGSLHGGVSYARS